MNNHVRNLHQRLIPEPAPRVGELLDRLGGPDDRLWPGDRWPRMRLDRPLGVGAAGGHGPIRYSVEAHEPGRLARFRFTRPRGFGGTHAFVVEPAGSGALLRHELVMRTTGLARLSWPLLFRPLHDALIEDALDRASAHLGHPTASRRWPLRVRLLRALLWRRPARPPRPRGGYAVVRIDGRVTDHDRVWWPDMNFGQFRWDGPIIPYELEVPRAAFLSRLAASYDQVVRELKEDDLLIPGQDDPLRSAGYPPLAELLDQPAAFTEVVTVYLGSEVLDAFLPNSLARPRFMINSVEGVAATPTTVRVWGRGYQARPGDMREDGGRR